MKKNMKNLIQNPHSCHEIRRFSVQQRQCPWKKTPSSSCLRRRLLSLWPTSWFLFAKKKSGSRSLLLWRRPALCGVSSWWVSALTPIGDVAWVPSLSLATDLPSCSLPELLPSAPAPHEQCHRRSWPNAMASSMATSVCPSTKCCQPSKFSLTSAEAMAPESSMQERQHGRHRAKAPKEFIATGCLLRLLVLSRWSFTCRGCKSGVVGVLNNHGCGFQQRCESSKGAGKMWANH